MGFGDVGTNRPRHLPFLGDIGRFWGDLDSVGLTSADSCPGSSRQRRRDGDLTRASPVVRAPGYRRPPEPPSHHGTPARRACVWNSGKTEQASPTDAVVGKTLQVPAWARCLVFAPRRQGDPDGGRALAGIGVNRRREGPWDQPQGRGRGRHDLCPASSGAPRLSAAAPCGSVSSSVSRVAAYRPDSLASKKQRCRKNAEHTLASQLARSARIWARLVWGDAGAGGLQPAGMNSAQYFRHRQHQHPGAGITDSRPDPNVVEMLVCSGLARPAPAPQLTSSRSPIAPGHARTSTQRALTSKFGSGTLFLFRGMRSQPRAGAPLWVSPECFSSAAAGSENLISACGAEIDDETCS